MGKFSESQREWDGLFSQGQWRSRSHSCVPLLPGLRDRGTRQRHKWSISGYNVTFFTEGKSALAQVLKWGQNGNIVQGFSTITRRTDTVCGCRSPAACVGWQKGLESGLIHANIRQWGGHGSTNLLQRSTFSLILHCKYFLICLKVKSRVISVLLHHSSQQEGSLCLGSCYSTLLSFPSQKIYWIYLQRGRQHRTMAFQLWIF